MSPAAKNAVYAKQLEAYDRLVATNSKVERKGATVPYTAVNGNMFSYLSKSGVLALRLPDEPRQAFVANFKAKLCEQYGACRKSTWRCPTRCSTTRRGSSSSSR